MHSLAVCANIVIMTIWCKVIEHKAGPRYLAIADAIAEGIANGILSPLDRLPPQRELAKSIGVSLNTVSRAYAEAARRGFLDGEVGRGTFVRAVDRAQVDVQPASLARSDTGSIDFSLNLPFMGGAAAALAKTLGQLERFSGLSSLLDHQRPGGNDRHASVAAGWIEQLRLSAAGRSIILCNGAQHGLLVALLALTQPGDVLLVEELTYAPIKSMARHLGLRLVPIALDADGLIPDALEAACKSNAANVLYCLPTLHTPTGITMSEARRRKIALIAEAHELTVIEDDVFGFLPTLRPKPLACFAPEHTIFITGVSKCMAPGLRVGYLHAPGRLKGTLESAVALSTWMPPPLMVEIATRWIEDGTARLLNEEQRSEASARQRIAREILRNQSFESDSSGFHLWLQLPEQWSADAFRTAASRRGVELQSAATFAVNSEQAPNAVRLCLSHEVNQERVITGLSILVDLINNESFDSNFVI